MCFVNAFALQIPLFSVCDVLAKLDIIFNGCVSYPASWFSLFQFNEKNLLRYSVQGVLLCTSCAINLGYSEKALIVPLWVSQLKKWLVIWWQTSFKQDNDETIKLFYFFFNTFIWQEWDLPCCPLSLSQQISVWLNSTDAFKTESRSNFLQKAFYDTELVSFRCLKLPHYTVPRDAIYFQSVWVAPPGFMQFTAWAAVHSSLGCFSHSALCFPLLQQCFFLFMILSPNTL